MKLLFRSIGSLCTKNLGKESIGAESFGTGTGSLCTGILETESLGT